MINNSFQEIALTAYTFHVLPSELINLQGFEKYLFDNACSLYISLVQNEEYEEITIERKGKAKELKSNDARAWL